MEVQTPNIVRLLEGQSRMSSAGSVTELISRLKAGDAEAARKLLDLYWQRLLGLAGKKLSDQARRLGDEEDVALSALASFFLGAGQGQFTQLHDRKDLWHLLVVITTRKAIDLVQHEGRQKRSPARDQNGAPRPTTGQADVEEVIDPRPPPDMGAILDEECQRLLDRLGDARLRSIAVWVLEGYTNEEIAVMLGCAVRTVERKLRLIRSIWSQENPP